MGYVEINQLWLQLIIVDKKVYNINLINSNIFKEWHYFLKERNNVLVKGVPYYTFECEKSIKDSITEIENKSLSTEGKTIK